MATCESTFKELETLVRKQTVLDIEAIMTFVKKLERCDICDAGLIFRLNAITSCLAMAGQLKVEPGKFADYIKQIGEISGPLCQSPQP
jgi:hypothetical protein